MVSGVKKRVAWRATVRGKTALYKAEQARAKKEASLQKLKDWKEAKAKRDQLKARQLQRGRDFKRRTGRLLSEQQTYQINREISKNMAIVRSKREVSYNVTRPTTGRVNRMPSSWIRGFAYDSLNQIFYMTVKTGKTYEWDHISPDIASNIIAGDASCRTNDTLKRKRWWVGKSPSAGAAYWKYLAFSR